MRTCAVDECLKSARARGLCPQHYQRWRRTGDALAVRRPGRRREKLRARTAEIVGIDISERTFARYWRATRMLWELGGPEAVKAAIQAHTRANGTMNVAAMERDAEHAVWAEAFGWDD